MPRFSIRFGSRILFGRRLVSLPGAGLTRLAVPLIVVAALAIGISGCGRSSVPAAEVAKEIQSRLAASAGHPPKVRGQRILEAGPSERFYQARKFKPAWSGKGAREKIVNAIRDIDQDGLTPADYHLEAIQSLLKEGSADRTALAAAELDLLLTDAIAAMIDHARYGRVRPVSLDPHWNVNPREGADPLEKELAAIAGAHSADDAIQSAKPQHFIYQGLVEALARLRKTEADGGWPTIPQGKPIKPGENDPRLAAIRTRLAATGELGSGKTSEPERYDPELEKAVKLFQQRHRLDDNGIIDKDLVDAMNVSVRERIAQTRVNLERARWVLNGLEDDFLLVNLPAYKAYLIRGGKNVWEARTQIGKEARQTPAFRSDLSTIVFNPDWTVPPTILAEDVLDGMRKGENMIAKKRLVILDKENHEVDPASINWNKATPANFDYTLRQPPGEGAALGRVKFLFPNAYSIYLHDTPSRDFFEAETRTFSSGCIRLEHPLELAERLLAGQPGWSPAKIQQVVDEGSTTTVNLSHTLPVLIVYWTVSVGASGEIRYMRDIYGLDAPVLAALDAPLRST
jgi:murein L,D-transpeptidase YcbB/YkuD